MDKTISIKPLLDIIEIETGRFDLFVDVEDNEKAVALFMEVFFKIKNILYERKVKPNMEINYCNLPSVIVKNIYPIRKLLPIIIKACFKYSPEIYIKNPLTLDYWIFDKKLDLVYFYDFSTDDGISQLDLV